MFLGWLVPGLGHLFLRHTTRGLVFLIAITATFWTGVAVGGLRSTVDPNERALWFLAQLGTGSNALLAWAGSRLTAENPTPKSNAVDVASVPHWRSTDVAIHYTGVAGLLNILVLLDVVARAESGNKTIGITIPGRGGVT
jgi:hypothetical protein